MGTELRNRLGISAYWNEEEINLYMEYSNKLLGAVYVIENIPLNAPANRARLWDKRLGIKDNSAVEREILKVLEDAGKPVALVALENIAIKRFF